MVTLRGTLVRYHSTGCSAHSWAQLHTEITPIYTAPRFNHRKNGNLHYEWPNALLTFFKESCSNIYVLFRLIFTPHATINVCTFDKAMKLIFINSFRIFWCKSILVYHHYTHPCLGWSKSSSFTLEFVSHMLFSTEWIIKLQLLKWPTPWYLQRHFVAMTAIRIGSEPTKNQHVASGRFFIAACFVQSRLGAWSNENQEIFRLRT